MLKKINAPKFPEQELGESLLQQKGAREGRANLQRAWFGPCLEK